MTQLRNPRWAPPPSSQDLKDLHEPSQSTRLCSCLGYSPIAICCRIRVHPRKSAVKGFLSSDQCHQCKSVVSFAFPAMLCDHPMTAMGPSPVIPRSKGLTRTIPIDAVVFLSWLSANCHCCRIRVYPRKSAVKGFLCLDQCHQCRSVVSIAFPYLGDVVRLLDHGDGPLPRHPKI